MDVKVGIQGLDRLNRALRAVDTGAPKGLRLVFNSAADLLVDRTRPKVPKVTGAAARSLVARSTRTAGRVGVGGKKAPYYPWLDFGGQGRIKGRPAKREFIREGRYLYPTLREIRPQIQAQLQQSLLTVARDAGLDVD